MQLLSAWLNDATISLHYRVGKLDFLVFIIGSRYIGTRSFPSNLLGVQVLVQV